MNSIGVSAWRMNKTDHTNAHPIKKIQTTMCIQFRLMGGLEFISRPDPHNGWAAQPPTKEVGCSGLLSGVPSGGSA